MPAPLTVSAAAARWGVTPSLVRRWCREGRIRGAVRVGPRAWVIPADAQRPAAARSRPTAARS
mgnify:CR=1 FL=1